jgi:hypothetical protein
MDHRSGSKTYEQQIKDDVVVDDTSTVVVEQNLSTTVIDATAEAEPVLEPTVVKQDEKTVGLLATDQLEEAIERCKERIEDISRSCRAHNQKFR